MATLLQSENSFAKYIVWCGVCTDESSEEFDLTTTDKILQVLEYSASGTIVKIYDTTIFEAFWDFSKLSEGHAYQITLRKGSGEVDIPNIAVSFSESTSKSKITNFCEPIILTPTPKPTPTPTPTDTPTPKPTPTPFNCCADMESVTLNNDQDGVSLQVVGQGFEGGKLCYGLKSQEPVLPGNSLSFFAKTNLGDFIAQIVISAKNGIETYTGFDENSSGRFVYTLPNGDCYEGDLEWANPDNFAEGPVFTKIDSENVLDFAEELSFTPTSARYYYMVEETPSPFGSGLNPNVDFNSEDYGATLLSAGKNDYGQLGSEFDGTKFNPSYISINSIFSCNQDHFVYLLPDGTISGGGLAMNGQLGDSARFGTEDSSYGNPEIFLDENLNNIKDVLATKTASIFISTDKLVWCLGENTSGELGTGDSIGFSTQVAKKLSIDDIESFIRPSNAPTDNSTLYLVKNSGDIYGCGFNGNNNLLLGTDTLNYLTPTKLPINNSEIVSICATDTTTLILKTDGNVYTTGDVGTNGVGGQGLSEETFKSDLVKISLCSSNNTLIEFTDIIQIFSNGKDAVVALKADGTVFTWGVGLDILGIDNISDYDDGFNYQSIGRTIPTKVDITNVKYVSMSRNCCFAVKNDGTLYTWGTSSNGENGLANNTSYYSPTLVSFDTFIDVKVESIISSSFTNYVKLEYS
tara:strand:+ start:28747 stop:30819 length:2073 start_codon:yes stop_codon:yes gene_type:complete